MRSCCETRSNIMANIFWVCFPTNNIFLFNFELKPRQGKLLILLYASYGPDITFILQWSDSCQSRQTGKNGQESSLGKAVIKKCEIWYLLHAWEVFLYFHPCWLVLETKQTDGEVRRSRKYCWNTSVFTAFWSTVSIIG